MQTPISSKTWSSLLDNSINNSQHIVKDEKGRFSLVDKSSKLDSNIHKLSLGEILYISKGFSRQISPHAKQIGLSLKKITDRIEKKHYSGIKKIVKLFHALVSGKANKYQTLSGRIQSFANKLLSSQTKNISDVPIQYYEKNTGEKVEGQEKPAKKILGQGEKAKVFTSRQDSNLVEKISTSEDISRDYLIGAQLDFPTIVKVKGLYIKEHHPVNETDNYKILKYKIFMEKIEGSTFHKLHDSLNEVEILKLLDEAKNTMLYLFEKKISWSDIHSNNIILTPEKNLKICDLGQWKEEDDNLNLTKNLFVGAMEIVSGILHSYEGYRSAQEKFKNLEYELKYSEKTTPEDIKNLNAKVEGLLKMIYPQKIFGKNGPNRVVRTGYYIDKTHWMKPLLKEMRLIGNDEVKLKEFLSRYVDAVVEGIKEGNYSTDITASTK